MGSQSRNRPAEINSSPSFDVIHYDSETIDLEYTIMQTMPMDLLNNGIKPFITKQLNALDNAIAQKMETMLTYRMISLSSIQTN